MKNAILFGASLIFLCSCGVKGKPLPPETPREIGIGEPTYMGVDKELKKKTSEDDKKEEKK